METDIEKLAGDEGKKIPVKLAIEDDEELLKSYGLVTALYASVDYILGEFVKLEGGLHLANQSVVNQLMDDKTFGPKIELAKKLISDEALKAELTQGLTDRNVLAHGVSLVGQDGQKFLLVKKRFRPLSVPELDLMIERARELGKKIFQEIQKTAQKNLCPPHKKTPISSP